MTTGTLLNLKLTLTPSNIGVTIGGSPTQQLITTLAPFFVGGSTPSVQVPVTSAIAQTVTHNIGSYPLVQFVDNMGCVVETSIQHTNANEFVVSFNQPTSGTIIYK